MNGLRRLSITARITIGSLIIATLVGLVAVTVVRIGVATILHNATVTLLMNDIAPYVTELENNPTGKLDEPVGGQEIAVVAPDGQVVQSTLPRKLEARIQRLETFGTEAATVSAGGQQYVVLKRDVATAAGTYQVIASRNTETTDLILDRLTVALLVGTAIAVIVFGAASWLLARAALRPVSRMREDAESIADVSSTGLLPVGPANDELAALATTLNDLLGRLRASADREKQMVSDASHELRTPLAVLRGQLELAELDAGDADALLADIRDSHSTAVRLSQLAANLLELSRIDAGASHGRSDWRELTSELAEAIDRARAISSDETELSIDFDYRPRDRSGGGVTVALSRTEFGRIVDNLLSNAITALEGSGVIGVELIAVHGRVTLTVRDSGPGMPEEFIPVALSRFTRAEGPRSALAGGGLGLAIVAALAASAGGSIVLANVAEGGLLATVTLPADTNEGVRA
ncbi:sensor histidine kinase [Diaminobutyricibacter sp. McL0608]|uniref:sensor histidine kinase n=1 Tax=Leifsonia sp. McL0608 TaxID=3143537 RepID=UPI0031F31375